MSYPLDPEDGRELKPGHMSCAEFRAWWSGLVVPRWQLWAFTAEPPDEGEWAMVPWIGWVRRKEGRRS